MRALVVIVIFASAAAAACGTPPARSSEGAAAPTPEIVWPRAPLPRSPDTAVVTAADVARDIYVVDRGMRDGARLGDRFVVYHHGEVFSVRVVHAFEEFSSARRMTETEMALADHHPHLAPGPRMPPLDGVLAEVLDQRAACVLSVGEDDGVEVGFEFTVYRDAEYIATVVVERVERDTCVARVKKGLLRKPMQVGDNASTVL